MGAKKLIYDKFIHLAPIIGSVLVLSGILLFIDQRIKTSWLSISIPLATGVLIFFWGVFRKQIGALILGVLILSAGGALFWGLQKIFPLDNALRLVLIFSTLGLCLLTVFLISLLKRHKIWWLLFISFIFIGLSVQFGIQQLGLLDFVFVQSIAVSLVFLIWGTADRLIGLIIPGTLLSTIGIGVFTAWNDLNDPKALQSTGIMLVWFSLGWILITIFNRIIHKKFKWWPLIPGGILLMVGAGLFIGGNPENAVAFIGNTGSIALILLGIYLILMKFGMNTRNH